MRVMVLLSGGIDSTTCLALAKESGHEVIAVSIYYGQRHHREMKAARAVANYYGAKLIELNLADIFAGSDCPLIGDGKEIPIGSYGEQKNQGPVSTYVPFRNGLMLAAAASMGLSLGASEIWYGAHMDDAAGDAYPDCSADFVKKINDAVMEGTAGLIHINAPFVHKTKAGVVKEGLRLNVPYHLTWSCYEGGEKPCGRCATCIDRMKAFEANGTTDPALKEERC